MSTLLKWLKSPHVEVLGGSLIGVVILWIIGVDGWIAPVAALITVALYTLLKQK